MWHNVPVRARVTPGSTMPYPHGDHLRSGFSVDLPMNMGQTAGVSFICPIGPSTRGITVFRYEPERPFTGVVGRSISDPPVLDVDVVDITPDQTEDPNFSEFLVTVISGYSGVGLVPIAPNFIFRESGVAGMGNVGDVLKDDFIFVAPGRVVTFLAEQANQSFVASFGFTEIVPRPGNR